MQTYGSATLACCFIPLLAVAFSHAADPAVTCESKKLNEAAKYASCRLKADSKAVKKNALPDYTKCESKFSQKWGQIETKAGPGICPSEGDEASMHARITMNTTDVVTLLSGGSVAQCQYLPATGQTTAFGPGSDGDVQAGAPLSYVDNGDGTITDLNTGLMWEKKDDSGGIHDRNNLYVWGNDLDPGIMDGTIVTVFLATLNAGGGFAGYTDWRIPNFKELTSIVDFETPGVTVDPVFHRTVSCVGCNDISIQSCSCTFPGEYWTSTDVWFQPEEAWTLDFAPNAAFAGARDKNNNFYVRAVRGGLSGP